MDSDFWAARFAAAKRQYALQQHNHSSHSDRFDGIELEEDVLSDFPCPYCYEDFDILSLCAHVEEEHPDESKITVCLHDLINLTDCSFIFILGGNKFVDVFSGRAKEISFQGGPLDILPALLRCLRYD
ncbi:hypothetical protein SAY86_011099 [Trapa natans]|uniref:Di19 zinc-binding domain-containing protein n=1 Tax=Trapa natans TaxID=22666 RepID=A0AAN7LXY4_TRANT|nr:hypothetical protein SAY86_011099 [Trapa natans]